MLVKLLKQNSTEYDISNFVSSLTWSGSVGQASRTLELEILYSPLDENIKDVTIALGDRIKFYAEDKTLLINAVVYERERKSEQGTINYTAHDDMYRLLQSNIRKNFKDTTPEKIVKEICGELQVVTGKIAETKVRVPKMLIDGDSYYTTIMKAYTKAYKVNGKKYMPIMVDRKLSVMEKGEIVKNFYLDEKVNITSSSYSESAASIKNKIKIYNEAGKQTGETKDEKSIGIFGTFQDVYMQEEGVNSTTASKSMIEGIQKSASIEGLGNTNCIAGYGIKIKDSISGLTGNFWIDTDSHTWADGGYTMSLDLTFKNLMDIQEHEDEEDKEKDKKSKDKNRAAPTDSTLVYITAASAKYHRTRTCSGMKECVEVTRKVAVQRGKGECKKCWGQSK